MGNESHRNRFGLVVDFTREMVLSARSDEPDIETLPGSEDENTKR